MTRAPWEDSYLSPVMCIIAGVQIGAVAFFLISTQYTVLSKLLLCGAMICVLGHTLKLIRARRRRRRRATPHCCVECGYDLRGSSERCPECGTEFE